MKLSIIIPAHNEEKTIDRILDEIRLLNLTGWEKEIIVVDDGSSDRTADIAREWATVELISHSKNLGKGAALKTGISASSGDLILIQDADLEYDPADIPLLLSAMDEQTGAVFGARPAKTSPKRNFRYLIGNKFLTWIYDLLFYENISDLCAGYKLFRADLLKKMTIRSNGFEAEAEIACQLSKMKIKIKEVPVNYKPRGKKEGKHIGLSDFWRDLWTILKYRLI